MRAPLPVRAVVSLLALAAGGLTACDLPLAPVPLMVTVTTDGADAVPGDGVCEVTAGAGDCSLRAAVEEGNALGAAAITLPAGFYGAGPLTVTGKLSINQDAPVAARLGSTWITVAAGASLVVDGLTSYDVPGARFRVDGTFVGRHLSLVGLESSSQLVVGPTGTAFVDNSLLAHVFGARPSVLNQGTLVLYQTALVAWLEIGTVPPPPTTPALSNSGTATVVSSRLQSCSGAAPVSGGYNSDDDGSCGLTGPGDQPAAPPAFTVILGQFVSYDLAAGSPLVDAVPVGVNGCGEWLDDDMVGSPRPVDGNGDGVVGCDIGARERSG